MFIEPMANIVQKQVDKFFDDQPLKNLKGTSRPMVLTEFSGENASSNRCQSSHRFLETRAETVVNVALAATGRLVTHAGNSQKHPLTLQTETRNPTYLSVAGVAVTRNRRETFVGTATFARTSC